MTYFDKLLMRNRQATLVVKLNNVMRYISNL